jgi:hypothetical protein
MVADFLEEEAMAHTKLVIGTTNRRWRAADELAAAET